MRSKIGRKIFRRGHKAVGTSNEVLGTKGGCDCWSYEARSVEWKGQVDRQAGGRAERKLQRESRMQTSGSSRQTDEDKRHADADMAVVPSGDAFPPPQLSYVGMFSRETDITT